jgi:hypothetical protein
MVNSDTGVLHLTGGLNRILGNVTNHGIVLVDGSTSFEGLSFVNNGQLTIAASGGSFATFGGAFNQAAGTLDVDGTLGLNGGSVNLTGGVMELSNAFTLGGGTFTQDGGTLNYTSGDISGGTYNYLGGAINGVPVLAGATLEIGPAATDPVSFLLIDHNTLASDVHAGQTLTVQNTTTSGATGLTSATGFTNDGSILLTSTDAGGASLTVTDGTLTNSATGLLHFQTGIGSIGDIFYGDLINNGTVTVDRWTTFDKPGGSYTNNGQFTINAASLTISNGGMLTNAAAAVVSGAGTLDGTLNNAGTVRATGGTLTLAGGVTTTNSGVFEAIDGSTLDVTAPLTNLSGGTLTGGTYRSVANGGTASLTVSGSAVTTIAAGTTVELSGSGATMSFGGTALAASLTDNAATLKIFNGHRFNMANPLANSGTVHLAGGGLGGMLTTTLLTNTGILTGNGRVHGSVMNTSGTVSPGNSPGLIEIDGDYTQGADGDLAIELLSPGNFDRLQVTGGAMLNGTLSVSLLGVYSPRQDDSWVILTAASVNGTFNDPQLPELTGDLLWKVLYDPTSVSLVAYLAGDYNRNGVTDEEDYTVWRDTLGASVARGASADGDFDGIITGADFDVWKSHFGEAAPGSGAGVEYGSAGASPSHVAVPEPPSWVLSAVGLAGIWRRISGSAA